MERDHYTRIYEPSQPWYDVVPVELILGKVPLVPDFPTGTIPHRVKGKPGFSKGKCDTKEGSGDGSQLMYINHFAMTWSRPKKSLFRFVWFVYLCPVCVLVCCVVSCLCLDADLLCPDFVLSCPVFVSVSNIHEAVLAVILCRAKPHQDRMLRPVTSRRRTVKWLRVENLHFKTQYVTGSACMCQPYCFNVVQCCIKW